MNWRTPIRKSDRGEVGRVYYLNQMAILPDGRELTRASLITLNPDQGNTVEEVIKRATQVPGPMKADLLKKRETEARLTSGAILRIWISDYEAPNNWDEPSVNKRPSSSLLDHNGNPIH